MPVTRKQKNKIRRSRESEMTSDLEKMDETVGCSHYKREDSEFGNSVSRPKRSSYDVSVNHNANTHSKSRENKIKGFSGNGLGSGEIELAVN